MAYRIAGIDVHKKMLAVVVADVEGEGEYQFERRQFGTTPDHLRLKLVQTPIFESLIGSYNDLCEKSFFSLLLSQSCWRLRFF
jgi:hypothetical protein